MVAQAPGHGLSREQILRLRYFVDGEARSRWNFRKNGPLLSNKARADTRLLGDLVSELEFQSLMVAPMTRGPEFQGLLLVADRARHAPFTDEDLNLLLAMAAQATVAVENMRLHSELKRANARLQEFDRLKSEFVGIVAHDFRRPLMAIRGFAELVLEEPDLPIETRQEFMRTVIRETDHLATLANDTLLITQIETGQFSYNWSEIDLGPFILDAVPLGLSEHSVLMDIPAGFPKILADAVRLRQVITNLTMNAVKYSPAGGSITVRCRERGTDHIVLEVTDHGLGIPPGAGGQALPEVRARAHERAPGRLRHRARPLHLPAHRGGPRRPDLGGVGAGQGQHLRPVPAPGRPQARASNSGGRAGGQSAEPTRSTCALARRRAQPGRTGLLRPRRTMRDGEGAAVPEAPVPAPSEAPGPGPTDPPAAPPAPTPDTPAGS